MTPGGLHLEAVWRKAWSVNPPAPSRSALSPCVQPCSLLGEPTLRAPGQPLPPASAPETPSFHAICLIPVNSRLTSHLNVASH